MAPANGSLKPRKAAAAASPAAAAGMTPAAAATASKPAQKKAVVPALPLPYVRRQAAAVAANANSPEAKEDDARSNGKPPKPKDSRARKDANSKAAEMEPTVAAQTNATNSPESTLLAQAAVEEVANRNDQPPQPPNIESPSRGSTDPAVVAAEVDQTVAVDANMNNGSAVAPMDRRNKAAVNPANNSNRVPKSRPPPPVSPTRYHMPPPFQPGNRMPGMHANDEAPRGPRPPMPNGNGHIHHHQAHLSNSSVHFGGFQESQSSSPAPPHSGGIAPPPGMPFPGGRQPFLGPGANGFPPMMPYGPDMMPVTTFDNYGRPSVAYAPPDSYPPYRNNYGPSAPHSFHDSHSSVEEFNQQYGGRVPMRNGGPVSEEQQMQGNANRMYGPPDFPRMVPNPSVPPHMIPRSDIADELVGYTQQQFGNLELSDCSLELRYLDDRAPPVRIPGHRFILNRSPELAALLRQQTLSPSPPDRSQQTLLIETNSKWIRSDSFYMAAQRLYGIPLLQYPGPRNLHDSGELTDAGSNTEQLDFALSYAAAGQLLGWAPVTRRGCEVATQLIDWQTIERVLEFALDGHNDLGTHDAYKYGDGSKIILDGVVTFIVHNFPPTFELDAGVVAPVQYGRLPMHPPPPTPAAPSALQQNAVSLADDTPVVQLGKGRRSQKITNIQFGDLTLTESKPASETETPKATRPAQPVSHSVLSRILLNIPFTQLKMILQSSGSGNVNGWANAESRYSIVKAAVEEREARRIRAVDAVADGRVPDAEMLRASLRAPEPRSMPRWGALGWHEEMLPYGNPDGPSLGRKWAPLSAPQGGPVAEYP